MDRHTPIGGPTHRRCENCLLMFWVSGSREWYRRLCTRCDFEINAKPKLVEHFAWLEAWGLWDD